MLIWQRLRERQDQGLGLRKLIKKMGRGRQTWSWGKAGGRCWGIRTGVSDIGKAGKRKQEQDSSRSGGQNKNHQMIFSHEWLLRIWGIPTGSAKINSSPPRLDWSCHRCNCSNLITSAADATGSDAMGLHTAASQTGIDRNHYRSIFYKKNITAAEHGGSGRMDWGYFGALKT